MSGVPLLPNKRSEVPSEPTSGTRSPQRSRVVDTSRRHVDDPPVSPRAGFENRTAMSVSTSRLKMILDDPLFLRVCHVVWAIPLLTLGGVGFMLIPPPEPKAVFIALLCIAFGLWGAWIMYEALFSSDSEVKNSQSTGGDGGGWDILLIIGAGVIALPITALIRHFRPPRFND